MASLLFPAFSVKVARHKIRDSFCGRLWKRHDSRCSAKPHVLTSFLEVSGGGFVIPRWRHQRSPTLPRTKGGFRPSEFSTDVVRPYPLRSVESGALSLA